MQFEIEIRRRTDLEIEKTDAIDRFALEQRGRPRRVAIVEHRERAARRFEHTGPAPERERFVERRSALVDFDRRCGGHERAGLLREPGDRSLEEVRQENVVVRQEREIRRLDARHPEKEVRRAADVRRMPEIRDAWISRSDFAHDVFRVVTRRVIVDAQPEVALRLAQHALERALQKLRPFVRRHDRRDGLAHAAKLRTASITRSTKSGLMFECKGSVVTSATTRSVTRMSPRRASAKYA